MVNSWKIKTQNRRLNLIVIYEVPVTNGEIHWRNVSQVFLLGNWNGRMMAGTTSLVSSNWEKSITQTYNAGQIQILFRKQNRWEWKPYRNGRRKIAMSIQAYNWFQNKSQWVTLSEKKNRKKLQETCWFLGCKFIAAPNLSLFFYLRTLHHLISPTVTIKRKPYLRCIERMSWSIAFVHIDTLIREQKLTVFNFNSLFIVDTGKCTIRSKT